MVPFYGQGLNCGLEDVRILNSYLTQHHIDPTTSTSLGETDEQLAAAFSAYSTARVPDLQAICDLALRNQYVLNEHRHAVAERGQYRDAVGRPFARISLSSHHRLHHVDSCALWTKGSTKLDGALSNSACEGMDQAVRDGDVSARHWICGGSKTGEMAAGDSRQGHYWAGTGSARGTGIWRGVGLAWPETLGGETIALRIHDRGLSACCHH